MAIAVADLSQILGGSPGVSLAESVHGRTERVSGAQQHRKLLGNYRQLDKNPTLTLFCIGDDLLFEHEECK